MEISAVHHSCSPLSPSQSFTGQRTQANSATEITLLHDCVPCSLASVPPGTPATNSASCREEIRADMGGLDKRKLGSVTEKRIQRHLNLV